jgi:antitoxin VapB
MSIETIKIEDISGEQFIKIPANLKIDDDKVYLKKVGSLIYVIPFHNPWQSIIDSLDGFSDDFMDIGREQQVQQKREPMV